MIGGCDLTLFARTNWRGHRKPFGIRRADRRAHMYVVGRTGTGKSTLLASLIRADLRSGDGLALLDPHGDLVEAVRAAVPVARVADLTYFDAADDAAPLGWNPLERVPAARRSMAASGMLEAVEKLWPDSWGPRLEHILRNALLCLFELPQATLADVLRLVTDERYRKAAAAHVSNPQVRGFWLSEFAQCGARFRVEAVAPLQNKIGAFLADPRLRRILTAPKSSFDLRTVMDEGKILLVNLSTGKIGEDAASLLGALLVAQIGTVVSEAGSSSRRAALAGTRLGSAKMPAPRSQAFGPSDSSKARSLVVGVAVRPSHQADVRPCGRLWEPALVRAGFQGPWEAVGGSVEAVLRSRPRFPRARQRPLAPDTLFRQGRCDSPVSEPFAAAVAAKAWTPRRCVAPRVAVRTRRRSRRAICGRASDRRLRCE